jgi:hypothetical protein
MGLINKQFAQQSIYLIRADGSTEHTKVFTELFPVTRVLKVMV